MERDSEGKERYIKTSEDETIMKSKVTQMGAEVATELHDATYEQRCTWIKEQKEIGNKLYQDKKIAEATDQYLRCLCGFDFSKKTTSKEERQKADRELKIPILNNMALCLMADQKF